jgi:hypothetical protein
MVQFNHDDSLRTRAQAIDQTMADLNSKDKTQKKPQPQPQPQATVNKREKPAPTMPVDDNQPPPPQEPTTIPFSDTELLRLLNLPDTKRQQTDQRAANERQQR